MKQLVMIMALTVGLLGAHSAQAQVNDTGSTSVFSKNQKFDNEGVELYESNLDMKAHKKIGFGFVAGGLAGVLGLNFEFNMEPKNAVFFGLGTGKGYNTFNFGWKHNFEGYYMSPYTKVGFSRWSDASNNGDRPASDSNVLKLVLTDDEIRDNRFSMNFITGAVGLEYNQLEGGLSGVNLFGEVLAMTEISRGKIIPTGSVGITYFY